MDYRSLVNKLDAINAPVVKVTIVETANIAEEIIEPIQTHGIAQELTESFGYQYVYEATVGQTVTFSGEPYKWMGAQWQNTKTGKVAEKGIKAHLDKLSLIQPAISGTSSAATKTAAKSAIKTGGKAVAKAVPFVGTVLSLNDAFNRWQEGDRSGAVIAALAGAGWLVPGQLGWVIGGSLDAANAVRDYKAGKFNSDSTKKDNGAQQGAQPSSARVTALQTELKAAGADLGTFGPKGDGVDGKMGEFTQKAATAHPEIAAKYKDVLAGQGAQPADKAPEADTAKKDTTTAQTTPLAQYYQSILNPTKP